MLHSLAEIPETGKSVLLERNADYFIDRTRAAAMGAIPDFRIAVQDVYEDIAAAKISMVYATLYLHLARQNNEWRIINILQEPPASAPHGIEPALLGQKLSDFTLVSVQGKNVSISGLRGKNVLLIFPRGRVDDHWCQVCHYQYAELADLEKRLQLRKKYNLEILFVLPYDQATVEHWVAIFPEQMAVIEKWKNPGDPAKISRSKRAGWKPATIFRRSSSSKKRTSPLPSRS